MESCTCSCPCHCRNKADYYWRDYDGTIPKDALSVGHEHSKNVYIGQIYAHENGLFIGKIIPGETDFHYQCYGVRKAYYHESVIKILCTQHIHNFRWLSVTSSKFEEATRNKHVVTGGYNGKTMKIFKIGRKIHDGVPQIGQVTTTSDMYFVHKSQDYQGIKEFEVLVYE